jgi:hypothetical protein
MGCVREADREAVGASVEMLGDMAAEEHGTERDVAARNSLRGDHDVGLNLVALAGEPTPRAPVAGDHFVSDNQDVVGLEHLLNSRPVVIWRNNHAGDTHYGFADKGGDPVGPDVGDHPLELPNAELGRILTVEQISSKRPRRREVAHVRQVGPEPLMEVVESSEGPRAVANAVIGGVAGEHH